MSIDGRKKPCPLMGGTGLKAVLLMGGKGLAALLMGG